MIDVSDRCLVGDGCSSRMQMQKEAGHLLYHRSKKIPWLVFIRTPGGNLREDTDKVLVMVFGKWVRVQ